MEGSSWFKRSILRTAWSTVEWSRPPKNPPISSSEWRVILRARNIAIWRGKAIWFVRFFDYSSDSFTEKWEVTTSMMSSIDGCPRRLVKTSVRTSRANSRLIGCPVTLEKL